ncbi:MAG: hypothetical protein AVDCRST_MAG21-166, partial [uncultured Nocardioidaceae bacterium]
ASTPHTPSGRSSTRRPRSWSPACDRGKSD